MYGLGKRLCIYFLLQKCDKLMHFRRIYMLMFVQCTWSGFKSQFEHLIGLNLRAKVNAQSFLE